MDINRNHIFLVGFLVLLFGVQLRLVDSYVLNERSTEILAKRSGQSVQERTLFIAASSMSNPRKTIKPPDWIGWCLISVGGVLVLHSLTMPKPS